MSVVCGYQRDSLTNPARFITFGHSDATHWVEDTDDIRSVQEELGNEDVKTTMRDTHVLNRVASDFSKAGCSKSA